MAWLKTVSHQTILAVHAAALLALATTVAHSPPARAADEDVRVEFHFKPVPRLQIAVWIEDAQGNFVQDVFVTQATGTLGIGNRPGRWDFLSSWRFPYGPRPQVLPVWAHARGRTYPKLVFHDDDPADLDSLGWHENSSSPEPYFCRPLTQSEHDVISVDTMTCPSPSTFESDKGKFAPDGSRSPYPPRGDLIAFQDAHDHPDARKLSELNDLDAVTAATPSGDMPEFLTTIIPAGLAQEPLVAMIEVNLEADQNASYSYDRDVDHYVDPRLSSYGIGYRGQPSVVYRVEFDALVKGYTGTSTYSGYGTPDGSDGELHPPDETISAEGGSGADRLQLYTKNNETFRFGVYSHGANSGGSETGGDDDGWGGCNITALPPPSDLELEPVEFDRVRVHFSLPELPDSPSLKNVRLFYRAGDMPIDEHTSAAAIQAVPRLEDCGEQIRPGMRTWCDLTELFGSTSYQVGVRYEDECSNSSAIAAGAVTTPRQAFATVDGFCIVATVAYGAPWVAKVGALREFRDTFLRKSAVGRAFIATYYTHGPMLARALTRSASGRAVMREVLAPIADLALAVSVGARGAVTGSPRP